MAHRLLSVGMIGDDVATLHQILSAHGLKIPESETGRGFFGPATRNAVLEIQKRNRLVATGQVDTATAAALLTKPADTSLISAAAGAAGIGPAASEVRPGRTSQPGSQNIAGDTYAVSGSVTSAERGGIGGLIVKLVDKNIGQDIELAVTTTDSCGKYQFAVSLSLDGLQQRLKTQPDLQVRIFARDTFLAASEVRYNASIRETLDVALPDGLTALPSEYETLTACLGEVYGGKLANLQETAEQQDITYLANKTGWDARTVGLVALAEQFSQITKPPSAPSPTEPTSRAAGTPPHFKMANAFNPASTHGAPTSTRTGAVGLKPEFYYALFRAGVPAEADGLFQTSPNTVRAVWEQAIKQGVIPQSLANDVPEGIQHFKSLSAAHTLDGNPPIGISTLREMLQTCLPDQREQQQFAQTYVEYRDDLPAFWNKLQQSLGAEPTKRLQLNGQLFYLTLNNAPLVQALHATEKHDPLSSALDLATRGYYEPAKWTTLIGTSIPSHIPGENADEQRNNYAKMLAAKVRLAFPTAVVADLVRRGTFRLSDHAVEPAHVADFLTAHQGKFAIGIEPVEAYIARTKLGGTSARLIAQIKRLQRVYQLTQDDQAMAALLQHDLDSAHAITRYDAAGFTRAFQGKLGGTDSAKAIHARAKQIYGAVLNIAVSYLGARVAPTLGGKAPVHVPFASPSPGPASSVIAYPTLESLFGSLDYCNCRECRSILSPAAYFVDLLNYIDKPSPTAGYENPQKVLFERRPDLQYLPLTCENTNTALPYIDIVNETLEYFVVNNSLANYQGYSTDSTVTSSELMASPQYVNDAAYVTLQETFFPPPLPFNRPLELLRLHLRKLGVTLSEVMAKLRIDDSVGPTGYGWRDILMEQLSLSRQEYRLFADGTLTLQKLYGYPDLTLDAVLQALSSVQTFSRRVGVSYDDLFSIVKTQFVNPNANLIPRLERLNAPFTTLQQLSDASKAAQFEISLLQLGVDARQYGGATPTDYDSVVTWVIKVNYDRIMSIITITDPANSADQCSGSVLQFRYSNPSPAKAQLTATDFVRLIRFVRLWRKLGLSIAQTDDILTALYQDMPTGSDVDFLKLLPRLGFLFQVMDRLGLTAETDLAPLLACWAPIATAGDSSLYYKMFLAPTVKEAGPQTATVAGTVYPGDVLITTINGIPIPYTVQAGDTIPMVASKIAAAINPKSDCDPDSDLPLNARIRADTDVTDAGVITIRAGFKLECAAGATATETYTAVTQTPLMHTATIAGAATAGDKLITTINGLNITYTVGAGDTLTTIASNIADAINETTTPDPFSGLPLNTLVVASIDATGGIVFESVNSGAPFRLTCSLMPPATGTYTAAAPTVYWTAVVQVSDPNFQVGFVTAINGVKIVYDYVPGSDGDIEKAIADLINTFSTRDPVTGLPLNIVVHASIAGFGSITITLNPGYDWHNFEVRGWVDGEGSNYAMLGPSQAPQTATVAGTFVEGTILTTTIDGVAVLYRVVSGDNQTTITSNIATTINATKTPDRRKGWKPLNEIVCASALAGVITITNRSSEPIADLFTLSCSISRGVYVVDNASDGPLQVPQTATVAGWFAAGSVLTTTIDDIAIPYTVVSGDNETTITSNIATAINGTETTDPYSARPLNKTVGASAVGGAITVTRIGTVREVNLIECSVTPPPPAAYTAGSQFSPFADDGYGNFLQDPKQTLFGHEPTLRAAFNLTGAEFARIATEHGFTASSPLTLDYISRIFRWGWLAHKLGLSVEEFIRFYNVTGLDPFAPLDPGANEPAEPHIIRFIRLLQAISAIGMEPVQALYLMWNEAIGGRSAPTIGEITGLARTLRSDFAAVEAQFTRKDDPDGSIAKGLMALVYDNAATDFFFGLLNGTLTTSVAYSNPLGQASLPPPVNEASGCRLSYDDLRKQLTFAGVLDKETRDKILAIGGFAPLHDAIVELADASQKAVGPFFATYPELTPLYTAYAASNDPLPQRRSQLLAQFLPILKQKRKEEQALASITAAIGTDPSFATALLQDASILHAATEATAAALTDLTAIESQGLSVQFFFNNNPNPTPDLTLNAIPMGFQTATLGGLIKIGDVLTTTINGITITYTVVGGDSTLAILAVHVAAAINATTSLDPVSKRPLNEVVSAFANGNIISIVGLDPAGVPSSFSVSSGAPETYTAGSVTPIAGTWRGYVDAPQDGFYDIYVETDAGAGVTLQIAGAPVGMEPAAAGNTWSNQSPISLKAGTLTWIVLTVTSLTSTLSVTWAGRGLGRTVIPVESLYSATLIDNLNATYVRFLKAASLATALSLTANEIADLGTARRFRVNTTDGLDNVPAGSTTFTPASMTNIVTGKTLVIGSGAAQEVVTVTATTPSAIPSKFSVTTAKPHDGTATPFAIVSQSFPNVGEGWLNFLSVSKETTNTPLVKVNASLCEVLSALLDFARLKRALSPRDERLLAVLQDPTRTLPDGSLAIRSLTGWALDSLNALLQRFFGDIQLANLSSIEKFRRIYDAFAIVKICRVTAPALIAVTTNAPSATAVRALQAALRAHYAEPDWAALIRPINDAMRIQQRDALVASILQGFGDIYEDFLVRAVTTKDVKAGATALDLDKVTGVTPGKSVRGTNIPVYATVTWVDGTTVGISPGTLACVPAYTNLTFVPANAFEINTADKLFEYFLLDVETQPAVETSRIRLALSSVQLFIERILRNLQPSCAPHDIEDPKHPQWPWMKRYRVWQANREVFLWPENWLYPELRDNQSPFFKETMSALLQSDITDDAAATAYLDYLTKLEAVAKLEPCGIYYEPDKQICHVVARTAGAHRKHYFRQYQSKDESWTPWTEAKIDCEDMPLTPIIWNGRLFLFWLKVLKQVPQKAMKLPSGTIGEVNLDAIQTSVKNAIEQNSGIIAEAVLCWSEFYNGKWQPTKTSDINRPQLLGPFSSQTDLAGSRNLWRIQPSLDYTGFQNDALPLEIGWVGGRSLGALGGFVHYNTHSLPVPFHDMQLTYSFPAVGTTDRALMPLASYTGGTPIVDTFQISYNTSIDNDWDEHRVDILKLTQVSRHVSPAVAYGASTLDPPFFFEDRRYLFYVTVKAPTSTMPMSNDFGILSAAPYLQRSTPNMQSPERGQKAGTVRLRNVIGGRDTAGRPIRYRRPRS